MALPGCFIHWARCIRDTLGHTQTCWPPDAYVGHLHLEPTLVTKSARQSPWFSDSVCTHVTPYALLHCLPFVHHFDCVIPMGRNGFVGGKPFLDSEQRHVLESQS